MSGYQDEEYDDDRTDEGEDESEDWQEGRCDRCTMLPGQVGPLGVCCACSIGDGARQEDCSCAGQ
jgi:hypothetical protein